MPTVKPTKGKGKARHFPYSPAGKQQAANYAQQTGGTMSMAPGMGMAMKPPMATRPPRAKKAAAKKSKKPFGKM